MNTEDEEFNRIENEADMRRKAVSAALNDHLMHMRANLSEYQRGVIDGRQMQMQSSVDKAVNALSQRQWIGLTNEEAEDIVESCDGVGWDVARAVESKLREKNT